NPLSSSQEPDAKAAALPRPCWLLSSRLWPASPWELESGRRFKSVPPRLGTSSLATKSVFCLLGPFYPSGIKRWVGFCWSLDVQVANAVEADAQ
ncbi:uncharacterized, partial [Tachysurus ichikawai]